MSLFVLVPVLMFILALTVQPFSDPSAPNRSTPLSRRMLVLVYGVILLGLSATTLPAMGLKHAGFMIFDGLLIYSLINGLTILIVLQLRIRINERQRIALEIQNLEIKQRFETERVGRPNVNLTCIRKLRSPLRR